ncbi:hypothetical protein ACFOMD_01950 [Sphingoaurantiacus capsulatus]|uniref:Uncharacterized protein n=1 Tax=Sphingoaurantiacus capsulatus TaxID=1771310 RepID=A0ABV7X9J5_9SPHN
MSLTPAQLTVTLGMAQLTMVAPALEGTYAGGTAATLGLALILVAQDSATWDARQVRESEGAAELLASAGAPVPEGHDPRLAALDTLLAETQDPALTRRILDFYVEITEAAAVTPPPLPSP